VLSSAFGNVNANQTREGDIISGGYESGATRYKLNIRPNVILEGRPRLELTPDAPDVKTTDYIATTRYLEDQIAALRTELLAQVRAEIAAERTMIPIGTIVMTTDRSGFPTACWVHITDLTGRFPIGAGQPLAGSNYEFRENVETGQPRTINAGNARDGSEKYGRSFVRLTENEIPSHRHNLWTYAGMTLGGNVTAHGIFTARDGQQGSMTVTKTHVTDSYGGGQPFDNRPPFYGVYFMRKTAHGC
jgi:hypothetical protein